MSSSPYFEQAQFRADLNARYPEFAQKPLEVVDFRTQPNEGPVFTGLQGTPDPRIVEGVLVAGAPGPGGPPYPVVQVRLPRPAVALCYNLRETDASGQGQNLIYNFVGHIFEQPTDVFTFPPITGGSSAHFSLSLLAFG